MGNIQKSIIEIVMKLKIVLQISHHMILLIDIPKRIYFLAAPFINRLSSNFGYFGTTFFLLYLFITSSFAFPFSFHFLNKLLYNF